MHGCALGADRFASVYEAWSLSGRASIRVDFAKSALLPGGRTVQPRCLGGTGRGVRKTLIGQCITHTHIVEDQHDAFGRLLSFTGEQTQCEGH
jgi:hypothetical protein